MNFFKYDILYGEYIPCSNEDAKALKDYEDWPLYIEKQRGKENVFNVFNPGDREIAKVIKTKREKAVRIEKDSPGDLFCLRNTSNFLGNTDQLYFPSNIDGEKLITFRNYNWPDFVNTYLCHSEEDYDISSCALFGYRKQWGDFLEIRSQTLVYLRPSFFEDVLTVENFNFLNSYEIIYKNCIMVGNDQNTIKEIYKLEVGKKPILIDEKKLKLF